MASTTNSRKNILFVYTSVSNNLLGGPTGWYLPEAAHPYWVLHDSHNITFAALSGPNPPLDPGSVELYKEDVESTKFLADETVKDKFANAKKLKDVNAEDYDAIFYVGGHGPMIDLATDEENIKLANAFYRTNKIVSAVCHGPGALVNVTDENGASIFKGRRATGFSNAEEKALDAVKAIPFLLEDAIVQKGGSYEKAGELWGEEVIVDGNVITGQNPSSARGVGLAIAKALA